MGIETGVILSYPDFEREVTVALDKWADAVYTSPKSKADLYKQDAEDLIAGWKAAYPRRSNSIKAYVTNYIDRRFNT